MAALPEPFLVGMAGGTASGKSTIARALADRLGPECLLLVGHDRYYLDVPEPQGHNYDHPDALDNALLRSHLLALKGGQEAELPVYEFRSHRRQETFERVSPRPVILVEGILVLSLPELVECFDLCVWVEASEATRLKRRVDRDLRSRGRTLESVIAQYRNSVEPMHRAHVSRGRGVAELVLSGEGSLEDSLAQILARLHC